MQRLKMLAILFVITCFLSSCATGNHFRADVYHSSQVNQRQDVEVVDILTIDPAKIIVDNREGKSIAHKAGLLIGALIGSLVGHIYGETLVGTTVGVITGAIGGSMMPHEVLADGVSLTYQKPCSDTVLNSVQVGNPCEYKKGRALLVSVNNSETRIQPNNIGSASASEIPVR